MNSGTSLHIFDRSRIRFNRTRMARIDGDHAFMHDWALENLTDRLGMIRRQFPCALLLGARAHTHLDDALKQAGGIETLVAMDSSASLLRSRTSPALVADEEALPFRPGTFDMIVSPLTLHSVNDLPGSLIQIRRSLKPDGVFLGAFAGGETLHELRDCLMQAELSLKGGASPRVAPFADKQQVGALMQRAGFALPVVDSENVTISYENIFKLMADLRGAGESNAVEKRSRLFLRRDVLGEATRLYHERYADPDGRLRATAEIIFMIGWAPDDSQPQPLKRGSATQSLSEALATNIHPGTPDISDKG